MKRYLNNSHRLVAVEFETFTQFLRRGDAIITEEEAKKIPEGVTVTDMEPAKKTRKTETGA